MASEAVAGCSHLASLRRLACVTGFGHSIYPSRLLGAGAALGGFRREHSNYHGAVDLDARTVGAVSRVRPEPGQSESSLGPAAPLRPPLGGHSGTLCTGGRSKSLSICPASLKTSLVLAELGTGRASLSLHASELLRALAS
jgi:hypothetical protein